MDANVVTDGTNSNPILDDPYSWNFHTADPQDVIAPTPTPPAGTVITCPPLQFGACQTYLFSYYKLSTTTTPAYKGQVQLTTDNKRVDPESNIGLKFNQDIIFGTSGTIYINSSSGVFQTFNITYTYASNKIGDLFWIDGDTLWLNPTNDMIKGTTYWVTMTSNCVQNSCGTSGNTQIADSTTATWTIDNGPVFNS